VTTKFKSRQCFFTSYRSNPIDYPATCNFPEREREREREREGEGESRKVNYKFQDKSRLDLGKKNF